jgi:hypothetical protein
MGTQHIVKFAIGALAFAAFVLAIAAAQGIGESFGSMAERLIR